MIDLHCHILPGIDDGAPDLETSLEMARVAVSDGIQVTACSPHMMPGIYDNTGPDVRRRVSALQAALDEAGIKLQLVSDADVHLQAGPVAGLPDSIGSAPRPDAAVNKVDFFRRLFATAR